MFKKLMTIAQTRLNNLNGPSFFSPFLNPFTRSASDCWRFSFYTMANSLRPFILMLMLSTGHHIQFNTSTHFSVFQENKAHSCHSFCQSFKHNKNKTIYLHNTFNYLQYFCRKLVATIVT